MTSRAVSLSANVGGRTKEEYHALCCPSWAISGPVPFPPANRGEPGAFRSRLRRKARSKPRFERKIFRQEEWCTEAVYATGYLEILVKSPVVEYKILLEDLDRWLKQPGGSPRDTALREKLKAILD